MDPTGVPRPGTPSLHTRHAKSSRGGWPAPQDQAASRSPGRARFPPKGPPRQPLQLSPPEPASLRQAPGEEARAAKGRPDSPQAPRAAPLPQVPVQPRATLQEASPPTEGAVPTSAWGAGGTHRPHLLYVHGSAPLAGEKGSPARSNSSAAGLGEAPERPLPPKRRLHPSSQTKWRLPGRRSPRLGRNHSRSFPRSVGASESDLLWLFSKRSFYDVLS